jgi:hypothetical protein
MFGSYRRELEADNRDLRTRVRKLVEERDEARDGEQAAVKGAAVVSRHLAGAEAAAKRTADRNQRLVELLELARAAQDDDGYAALQARLERALRACARYRAQLPARRGTDRLSLAMLLELSERARASLDTQLRTVQQSTARQERELAAARRQLAAPDCEPGEVAP